MRAGLLVIGFLVTIGTSFCAPQPVYLQDQTLSTVHEKFYNGRYKEASDLAFSRLKEAQKEGNILIEAEAYRLLAEINRSIGQFTIALSLLNKAEQAFNSIQHQYGIAATKNRKAAVYYELGDVPNLLPVLENSIKNSEHNQFNDLLYNNLIIKGAYFREFELDYSNAITTFKHAELLLLQEKRIEDLPYLYQNICALYKAQKNYDSALHFAYKTIEISDQLGVKSAKSIAYKHLSDSYKELKKYDSAWIFERKSNQARDSLAADKRTVEIGQLLLELDEKRAEIIKSEKEYRTRMLSIALFIVIVLLISTSFLAYK